MVDTNIIPVTSDVTWIGVLDRDIRTFDIVMETQYGTTYNSYFINSGKKVVIETAKEKFWPVYESKLRKVVNPEEIDYIILDHTEPDHSGSLGKLLEIATKAVVVGSGNAIRYLKDQVGHDFPNMVVKDGNRLDLGNKTLRFIGTPNLHWPDSIVTYLEEEQILFTCDIFGEHFCHEAMFDDLAGDFDDAFRYYFDVIMRPYSRFMVQAIEKIRPLQIRAICPGHGMILRSKWKKYVDLTEQYAREYLKNPAPDTVFLGYVSSYNYTATIAEKIAEGIRQSGNIEVDICNLEKTNLGVVEQKLIRSSAFILGCPTFNQNLLLPVYQVFALINPIRDKGKPAAAFGSYGWSGEAVRMITSNLRNLKLNVLDDGLMVKFSPHNEILEQCIEYGRNFGKRVLETK
ncbi:MAG: FprA family A-type flavoprotein [Bacteroidota bacterium]|nr:FprA family A-type flavoprotein [Bacteroidota bacterium]